MHALSSTCRLCPHSDSLPRTGQLPLRKSLPSLPPKARAGTQALQGRWRKFLLVQRGSSRDWHEGECKPPSVSGDSGTGDVRSESGKRCWLEWQSGWSYMELGTPVEEIRMRSLCCFQLSNTTPPASEGKPWQTQFVPTKGFLKAS